MDPLSIAFIVFLLGSGGKKDSGESRGLLSRTRVASPQELLGRATQPRAAAWAPYFLDVGETPAVSDALARWTGLESGGDPTIVSSLGERGLLQVGKQTQSEGGITAADWDELTDPSALPNEQARIASGYWRWLYSRALKHLAGPVPDGTDQVWFAYQYHQRPKDFTEWGQLPNNAASASAFLMSRAGSSNDQKLFKRVTASNVVAYGTPDAPAAPMV